MYVIQPDKEELDRLTRERDQLQREITRYKRLIRPQALKPLEEQLAKLKEEEKIKREELEKVVGEIPTQQEIEKVFGRINNIALSKEVVITRIALASPKTQNLQLVEKDGKKFVKVVATQQQQKQRRGRRKAQTQAKSAGVPLLTMEVSMNLEGETENIYAFLKEMHRRGFLSYPKSVSIKPIGKNGIVSASVVIDVILQK